MLIYWDIDGTIIDTGISSDQAIEEMKQRRGITSSIDFYVSDKGKTDWFMMYQYYVAMHQALPTDSGLYKFAKEYEDTLCKVLAKRTDILLPHVKEILSITDKVEHRLFTGNRQYGALQKIKLVGLMDCINVGKGLYGDKVRSKYEIIQAALRQDFDQFQQAIFISDSAYDIACANRVNAISIGVLTGNGKREDLERAQPRIIWRCLPSPDIFYKTITQLQNWIA